MIRRQLVLGLMLVLLLSPVLVACNQLPGAQAARQPTAGANPAETLPPVRQVSAGAVSAEAIIVPFTQADLSFRITGRVQEVLVAEGDHVTAGQELIKLETRDLEQALLRAEAGLKSAQAQLAQIKAGNRPEKIAAAEAQVAMAQAEVQAAEMAVQVAEGDVAAAKAALANAEAGVKTAEMAALVAYNRLTAAQKGPQSAQAELNKIAAGPTQLELAIAEKRIELARNELWGLQGQRDALGGPGGNAGAYEAAKGEAAAGESRVQIAQMEYEQLRAGPKAEDIAIAQSKVAEAQANVEIAQAQLYQANAEVESAKTRVLEAQASVLKAEGQLGQIRSKVDSARAEVQRVEAELNALRAGPQAEDIAVAEAAVAEADANLMEAQHAMEDAVLKAPFDGTVGEILVQTGETASPQIVSLRLGDLTRFRVKTEDLSEVDINQVQIGQTAEITVDALPGAAFRGTVARVASVASDFRGDRVYEAIIDLETEQAEGLLWGMTAFVEIDVR